MDPDSPPSLTRAQLLRGAVLGVAGAALTALTACASDPAAKPHRHTTKKPAEHTEPQPEPQWDIDSPESFQVVVNKARPLTPLNYAPDDLVATTGLVNVNGQPLRREVYTALTQMLSAAAAAGVGGNPVVQSAYRSYELQQQVYGGLVNQLGQTAADATSARPGHSEHQTGLAVDLDDGSGCSLQACFGETPLGRWLAQHCWEYGFILRYPADKVAITGFEYEPWHFRYVQKPLAQQMHEKGVTTLEEFFDLPAAPNYVSR